MTVDHWEADPRKRPHPVTLDVEYPERLSRLSTFFRLLLAIPQLIVVYLLGVALFVLTIIAWFAILFTARYPKSIFQFNAGVLRWQANVYAYLALFRDEYPPFEWEPGLYPLAFDVPYPERQSRFRLFIRWFAVIPNQLVFLFVSIAWWFTTFISWFAILITGRYPRGLFKFGVGGLRWLQRSAAYTYLLRDEYPPYSINADARPGNEVVSAIIGFPLGVAYIALSLLPYIALLAGGEETRSVNAALLSSPGQLRAAQPSAEANSLRITLVDYDDDVSPVPSDVELRPGHRLVSFRIVAEKDGFLPTFFTPALFFLDDCFGTTHGIDTDATIRSGFVFDMYWRGGHDSGDIHFQVPRAVEVCELWYFAGAGRIRFLFE